MGRLECWKVDSGHHKAFRRFPLVQPGTRAGSCVSHADVHKVSGFSLACSTQAHTKTSLSDHG